MYESIKINKEIVETNFNHDLVIGKVFWVKIVTDGQI